ncbi:ATP-binding protein [Flavobacterium sp.]|uniref:sensor histidine kinase n=1 Tax=Flavobacterium sp. TaxID=239 RepID=UPI002613C159|nr:ATP-binding protein [Flavobacterium sp.]
MNEIVLGIIIGTLLILLLIFGIFVAFSLISKQRLQQEKRLAEAKLIFEKEIRLVESEVSENIMTQLANELHDNVGQLLTVTHIHIENQKIDDPGLVAAFRPVETYLNEITQQIRMLSRTLNNDFIGSIGLRDSIPLEIERLRTLKRFNVHCTPITTISGLNKDEELIVFRIFQEITQNALRHAKAKNLYVAIVSTPEYFEFCVQDDGKGFDKNEVFENGRASGLRNISKRATLALFDCEIQSASGKGTKIVLKKITAP